VTDEQTAGPRVLEITPEQAAMIADAMQAVQTAAAQRALVLTAILAGHGISHTAQTNVQGVDTAARTITLAP
jgi:hypothetical protein